MSNPPPAPVPGVRIAPAIDLDALDLRLLAGLQEDASRSNQALAEAAGVSPATALRRVRRLEEAGVIERTVAIVSPQAVGAGLSALVEVTLDRQGAEHLDAFEARAVAEPAVQQCWRVSPGPDFVLVVHARDMAGYHSLAQRLFTQDANVRNVKTYFAIKRAKFGTAVVLPGAA
ncbi:MAG: Lrp/AsnC family transcriptional regulator [Rubrivivax sp.]